MKIYEQILSIILVVGTIGVWQPLNAQWNFNLAYDQEYNDNPFRMPETQKSWVSAIDLGLERELENFTISYYGNYSQFNAIMARNFYWHQIGVSGGTDSTRWGFLGEQRFNKSEYQLYDYFDFTSYYQHQFLLHDTRITWNGSLNYNKYKELPDLNNWKFNASANGHKSFPTRTTLIGGLSFHYKMYPNSANVTNEIEPETWVTLSAPQNPFSNWGNGHGRGRMGYLSPHPYSQPGTASVSQFTFWLRVAQSITPTTGLALQFHQRKIVTGSNRYISGLAYSYSQESELFDDPMGHGGNAIASELTQLLPFKITMKLAASYMTKNYSAEGIYLDEAAYSASVLRKDLYKTAWASLRKNIGINFRDGAEIVFYLNYQWLENQSNSYWYDYTNTATSIGFEFEF